MPIMTAIALVACPVLFFIALMCGLTAAWTGKGSGFGGAAICFLIGVVLIGLAYFIR